MKQYLKMVDVFPVEIRTDDESGSLICDEDSVILESLSGAKVADYTLHAINSHDELVEMNKDLLAALEDVIDDKAPLYHDCIDNGESECGWCIARKAIAKAKGGAA